MTDSEQTQIDPFREMNRYDGRHEDWASDAVFEPPRRTLGNYWKKFHAARDCGARGVRYVEQTTHRSMSERHEYELRCPNCQHKVPETDVLFIGGDWFSEHGWLAYGDSIENLWLPESRVLELGPDPEQAELERALNLTRIENNTGGHGVRFGNEHTHPCEDCGKEAPLHFDDHCRMCYDGEWTERMQSAVDSFGIAVRERNGSFVHRLEKQVDPLSIRGRAFEDKILWRRHAQEQVPKLVEVTQCLKDASDDHFEYILTDLTHTSQWRYHEDDLADCFWDTGLYSEDPKPVMDDRIRELWERVCGGRV